MAARRTEEEVRTALALVRCSACGASHHCETAASSTYTYLLGVYLGDGHVSHCSGRTYSLRVALDTAYPGIVEEVAIAIEAVRGRRPWIGYEDDARVARLVSYWRQWPCWFPQHGPGRKHDREIKLEPWQIAHVKRAPGGFLRGLIQTDGWRGLNRVTAKGRAYAYPRYQFSNRSDDIRCLFTETCDLLGIEWRPWGRFHISIARRASVARLDRFVGPKA